MQSLDAKVSVKVIGDELIRCLRPPASAHSRKRPYFSRAAWGIPLQATGSDLTVCFCAHWIVQVHALSVKEVYSSFFADKQWFPENSIQFDHALVMRNLLHEWHQADGLYALSRPAQLFAPA